MANTPKVGDEAGIPARVPLTLKELVVALKDLSSAEDTGYSPQFEKATYAFLIAATAEVSRKKREAAK